MRLLFSSLFMLSCIGTALVSNHLLGAGMWFWVILFSGIIVGFGQQIEELKQATAAIALLMSVVSIGAVLLGLVAATAGGFFSLDGNEALLLLLFGLNAVFGVSLFFSNKKQTNTNQS